MAEQEFVDYYAFLMISRQADRDMIEWAVRLMLTRYGAKNPDTADAEKYETTKAAYRALVDPAKREEYDKLWDENNSSPSGAQETPRDPDERRDSGNGKLPMGKITVELEATVDDVELQQRLRIASLSALYDIMIRNPRDPELGRADIAKAVHCRIDDLEFPIWFLREQGLLKTSNSGLYSITSQGVEWVESGGVPHLTPQSAPQPVELPIDTLRAG